MHDHLSLGVLELSDGCGDVLGGLWDGRFSGDSNASIATSISEEPEVMWTLPLRRSAEG
jgi:hypothetical protein